MTETLFLIPPYSLQCNLDLRDHAEKYLIVDFGRSIKEGDEMI